MPSPKTLRIGVDTGGTFTDLVLDAGPETGLLTHKLLSTPHDPALAVLEGIGTILDKLASHRPRRRGAEQAPPHVVHGSTVATNCLLEGKTARAVFVTTAGFEDTLAIGRQNRPELYDLCVRKPDPLVPRQMCLGVPHRIAFDGRIIRPLPEAAVRQLVEKLRTIGADAIAISLLHSYANPDHERMIATALRQAFPEVHLTVSHELLPEFREYERAATCVANALVAPRMVQYISTLADAIGEQHLRVMSSAGGSLPPSVVCRQPIQTVLSGPVGGVLGALWVCGAAGIKRIITLDMGGTSTDVSLCDGELTTTSEGSVADVPIRLPMVDIHTVGAGGGSIAWLDAGGALRVGPQSTGADPGPASYGKQRKPLKPTVTDAHVVLGHLSADCPLGGDLVLDGAAARRAVKSLADAAGLSIEQTAAGILRVVETTMARAIQRISVQRGHDPRDFTLVPFGGAGGLHACRLADQLDIPRVLVPNHPGLLSAIGMLHAAPLYTFARAIMRRVEPVDGSCPDLGKVDGVQQTLDQLQSMADQALAAESINPKERSYERSLDLRYVGQSYELTIPLARGDTLAAFERRHQQLYGYTAPDKAIEIVAVRLRATGPAIALELPRLRPGNGDPLPLERDTTHDRPQVNRDTLTYGDRFNPEGPGMIVSEYSATTFIPASWSMTVNEFGQLLLQRR